jgi:hypothetical protein
LNKATRPDWRGRTVVVLASGPSLTPEDIEAVRQANMPTIVTNTTFRSALWADMIIGFDAKFWERYGPEIGRTFSGRRVSMAHSLRIAGCEIETTYNVPWFEGVGNSGACAVAMAVAGRAQRVILLGMDCEIKPGSKAHHHGDHPLGMSNCLSIKKWPGHFQYVAGVAKVAGVQVINASRSTSLHCFVRGDLGQLLGEVKA